MVARMARMIMGMLDLRAPGELARRLLVTDPWPAAARQQGHRCADVLGRRPPNISTSARRAASATSARTSRASLRMRSPIGATCRRSGTRVRASVRP
jgi:hypothetical protein